MIIIPNYTIEKEIGHGGMATVYLAIQDKLKRKVALKVMTPDMAKDENFRKSFLSEATIIASLDHPNIVRIYDVEVVDESILYMAMEYLSGDTLKARLLNGKMSFADSLSVITQVAQGLIHAHNKGYIHRDIKPGNILFRGDGTAVLTDFGIAKLQDTSGELTKMGFTMGTLQYMSPEQVITTDLDQRSDVYSLGLVFYEMLSGLKAFRAESTVQAIHQHTTVPPPELDAQYSYLQPVLDKVLAKQPEERYQGVSEFITAIKTAGESDKTVIYRVSSNDHDDVTRIIAPEIVKSTEDNLEIPQKKRSGLPIILSGAALVCGGLFAAYQYISLDVPSNPLPVDHVKEVAPIQQNEGGTELQNTKLVSSEPQAPPIIETADRKVNYFYQPQIQFSKLESELESLDRTTGEYLAFSSDNLDAKENNRMILSKYASLVESSIMSMNLEKAYLFVEKGLAVSKNDAILIALKNKLESKNSVGENDKKSIAKLFSDAKQHLINGNFVLPKGKNALDSYQKVLLINPNNSEAVKKIRVMQRIFEQQIKKNLSNNIFLANSLINQARALFPYNEKFIQFQQEVKSLVVLQ